MALEVSSFSSSINDDQDITRNLPSLTFESALSDEEKQLLCLRQQNHAHTVITCASAAFLVSVLNEVRQVRADLAKTTKQRRAIKLLTADSLPKDPLQVGMIGCGRLGTHLAQSLLTYGDVNPCDIIVSTRRPETIGELRDTGVTVCYDNIAVAATVHILFICVLPSQLAGVIEQIKHKLTKNTLVYSIVNSTTAAKLQLTLETKNIFLPKFVFNDNAKSAKLWNNHLSISQALADERTINASCPLTDIGKGSCVHLTEKWVELVICAFINMCTELSLTSDAALDLLHGVCFGIDSFKNIPLKFTETDFVINWEYSENHQKSFPIFDLSKLHGRDSNVALKLQKAPELQMAFVRKFCSVFNVKAI